MAENENIPTIGWGAWTTRQRLVFSVRVIAVSFALAILAWRTFVVGW